jgi:hypothetical protein
MGIALLLVGSDKEDAQLLLFPQLLAQQVISHPPEKAVSNGF